MKEVNLELIKKQRTELKLSMQEMADLLGFKNASTYLKYESGDYKFKANHLPILAKVFGCNIDELFFDLIISKTEILTNNTA